MVQKHINDGRGGDASEPILPKSSVERGEGSCVSRRAHQYNAYSFQFPIAAYGNSSSVEYAWSLGDAWAI